MIADKTVVYTSGTFDMLHVNHLKMINYARALGDILIVGVNTDELVASYKSQPIIPFEERIALMRKHHMALQNVTISQDVKNYLLNHKNRPKEF